MTFFLIFTNYFAQNRPLFLKFADMRMLPSKAPISAILGTLMCTFPPTECGDREVVTLGLQYKMSRCKTHFIYFVYLSIVKLLSIISSNSQVNTPPSSSADVSLPTDLCDVR